TEKAANDLLAALDKSKSSFELIDKTEKAYTRKPYMPYTTSTLQQDASRRLRASVRDIMSAAQSLYENGFITYMRTDSPSLSEEATHAARESAISHFSKDSVPASPRVYAVKSKNAQEAHEAIRPAGAKFKDPESLGASVSDFEKELYALIWRRTLASQMNDVKGVTVNYKLQKDNAVFSASGTTITDKGFLAVYADLDNEKSDADNQKLPNLEKGTLIEEGAIELFAHETTPPARYTEASLIKKLEELSIGRPSTYASTIATLRARGYITEKRNPLIPTWTAFAVVSLLEKQVPELLDYEFTATMEDGLDEIAAGKTDGKKYLHDFYYNVGKLGLHNLAEKLNDINARDVNTLELGDGIILRHGKYGAFFEDENKKMPDGITPVRVSVPDDVAPSEVSLELAKSLLEEAKKKDKVLGADPKTGNEIVLKNGKWGDYISEVLSDGSKAKPKTASLFKNMDPEKVTLDDALRLLSIPRLVGKHPKLKADMLAYNGRFGPYLKAASETRSLPSEDSIFTISEEEAIKLIDTPKARGRGAAPALRVFGADPENGKIVLAKNGRFGTYITDGITNVSIPKGKDPETMDPDDAYAMLAEKRAKSSK
ncbi:MAG: DNA topoisomerase I, partial [Bifidobacteriaceae bacterium]|nr:DNA topoisomerase I [Bifidobacteriaceae bacterium]